VAQPLAQQAQHYGFALRPRRTLRATLRQCPPSVGGAGAPRPTPARCLPAVPLPARRGWWETPLRALLPVRRTAVRTRAGEGAYDGSRAGALSDLTGRFRRDADRAAGTAGSGIDTALRPTGTPACSPCRAGTTGGPHLSWDEQPSRDINRLKEGKKPSPPKPGYATGGDGERETTDWRRRSVRDDGRSPYGERQLTPTDAVR
jgi:hypothetical protein